MHPKDGRVVPNFIIQALTNQQITIYGEGRQTRSFCYVADLIEGFMRLMATDDDFTGPVNLGNESEFTIKELALLVIDLSGSSSKIIQKPLPQDDPLQRCPNISLAREKLNWAPTIQLKEGLGKTIDYFEKTLETHNTKNGNM